MTTRTRPVAVDSGTETVGSYVVVAGSLVLVFLVNGLTGAAGIAAGTCEALTLVVVGVASWWLRPRLALALAAMAFLFVDGFGLGGEGQLSWDGTPDLARLSLLLITAATTSGLSLVLAERRRNLAEKSDRALLEETARRSHEGSSH
jgi:hypothetical protein